MVSSSLSSFRFVDDGLHRFHPLDIDILVGLAAVITHQTTFQVCLLQECHIYECHASQIEAEQEQVSSKDVPLGKSNFSILRISFTVMARLAALV